MAPVASAFVPSDPADCTEVHLLDPRCATNYYHTTGLTWSELRDKYAVVDQAGTVNTTHSTTITRVDVNQDLAKVMEEIDKRVKEFIDKPSNATGSSDGHLLATETGHSEGGQDQVGDLMVVNNGNNNIVIAVSAISLTGLGIFVTACK